MIRLSLRSLVIPCPGFASGASKVEALALVRPWERVVGVQIDWVQVVVPFRVEVEMDRHRRVLAVPWVVVLRVGLDLV